MFRLLRIEKINLYKNSSVNSPTSPVTSGKSCEKEYSIDTEYLYFVTSVRNKSTL